MKNLVQRAVLRSGLLRMAGSLRGRGAAILMYHSVMEDPRSQDNLLGDIIHSRDSFRGQMELLARNYHPITLQQVDRLVRGKDEFPDRAVVVSFDDGYADNYEVAAPILNQFGIPAVFYATVECVENGTLPWPAPLRFAFRTTKKTSWTDSSGKSRPLSSAIEREEAFAFSCGECCKLTGVVQRDYVATLEVELDTRVPVESGRLMMNYDQMRALVKQGHTVGSHTMSHPNMAHISLQDARRELAESKRILEHRLDAAVAHFSYPCPALSPHWTEQTVAATCDAEYQTAVTTDGGVARKGDSLMSLKRVRPTKTVEGLRWNLECAFAGRTI
jgi:peptidoglycan/xylan/chitin deacetylase (PgdA/CDA1 family)